MKKRTILLTASAAILVAFGLRAISRRNAIQREQNTTVVAQATGLHVERLDRAARSRYGGHDAFIAARFTRKDYARVPGGLPEWHVRKGAAKDLVKLTYDGSAPSSRVVCFPRKMVTAGGRSHPRKHRTAAEMGYPGKVLKKFVKAVPSKHRGPSVEYHCYVLEGSPQLAAQISRL